MTVQCCKALGAERVILIGTRTARLDLGLRLGADVVLNAREQDVTRTVRDLTGGLGVDLAIEASGSLDAPQQCVEIVKRGGKVLFLAFYRER